MTTSYPGAIDTLTNPTPSDPLNSATVPHASQHANANDAIEAIQTTLGTNPQGSDGTVKGRFIALEGAVLNLNNAIDERVPGETGSNQPVGARPDGYIWVDTTTHAIKVWNGTAYVDPSNAGGGMTWAVATGGTESTVGGDRLHTFAANGSLVVTQAGYARVLVVGAGGSTGSQGGSICTSGGGVAQDVFLWLPVGTHAVTVGATAPSNSTSVGGIGGPSSLGSLIKCAGGVGNADFGNLPNSGYDAGPIGGFGGKNTGKGGTGCLGVATGNPGGPGRVSDITGASVEYGQGGNNGAATNTAAGTGSAAGDNQTGRPGIVVVRYTI